MLPYLGDILMIGVRVDTLLTIRPSLCAMTVSRLRIRRFEGGKNGDGLCRCLAMSWKQLLTVRGRGVWEFSSHFFLLVRRHYMRFTYILVLSASSLHHWPLSMNAGSTAKLDAHDVLLLQMSDSIASTASRYVVSRYVWRVNSCRLRRWGGWQNGNNWATNFGTHIRFPGSGQCQKKGETMSDFGGILEDIYGFPALEHARGMRE